MIPALQRLLTLVYRKPSNLKLDLVVAGLPELLNT